MIAEMYLKLAYLWYRTHRQVRKHRRQTPSLVLTGAARTGKSLLACRFCANHRYVRFGFDSVGGYVRAYHDREVWASVQSFGVSSRRHMVGRRPCEVGIAAVCGAGGFRGPWQGAGVPMKPRRKSGRSWLNGTPIEVLVRDQEPVVSREMDRFLYGDGW